MSPLHAVMRKCSVSVTEKLSLNLILLQGLLDGDPFWTGQWREECGHTDTWCSDQGTENSFVYEQSLTCQL